MNEKISIYGQEIELQELEPNEHAMDIMIITRVAKLESNGRTSGTLCISTTEQTDWIVQTGIIQTAKDILKEEQ